MAWIETPPISLRTKLARFKLLDDRCIASARPLQEHLDDCLRGLRENERTPDHVRKSGYRIRSNLDGIGAVFASDLSGRKVSGYLADRRKLDRKHGRLNIKSSNHYAASIKGLCAWLVQERRLTENPLDHLTALNAEPDRKHVRRALDATELQRLLTATRAGPDRCSMSGDEHHWLCWLAAENGLRGCLKSLFRAVLDTSCQG